MSYFFICKEFGINIELNNKKYTFSGLSYKGRTIINAWEDLAFLIVVFTDFSRKELEKKITYNIGCLEISRVERNSKHYLRIYIAIGGEAIYLNQTEVKFFPAICNRILARCDILKRENEYEQVIDNYWIGSEEEQT